MQRRTTSPHHEIATTIADGKDGIEKGRAAMKRGSLAVGRSKGEKVTFTNDVLVHMDSDSEKKIKLNASGSRSRSCERIGHTAMQFQSK